MANLFASISLILLSILALAPPGRTTPTGTEVPGTAGLCALSGAVTWSIAPVFPWLRLDDDDDDDDCDEDDGDDDDGDCNRIEEFCDGSEGCPCNNDSSDGGCVNSTGSGSPLTASGSTSVAADDLVLTAPSLDPNKFAVLFMGSEAGRGAPFGDGRLCVGGRIFRFSKQSTGSLGTLSYGPGLVSDSCMLFGSEGCITAGSTWFFQLWYRGKQHGECSSGFNTTNGLEVTFRP